MLRVLFSVLAVVSAVLAFVFDQPLLYAAAAVLVLMVIVLMLAGMRQRHREAQRTYARPTTSEDELKSLGIMDIRPRERSTPARASTSDETRPAETNTTAGPWGQATPRPETARPVSPAESLPDDNDATSSNDAASSNETAPSAEEATPAAEEAPPDETTRSDDIAADDAEEPAPEDALNALLQALRAALGAATVCVLQQPDVAPDYEVVAGVGTAVEPGTVFAAQDAFMTAGATQQPVAVRAAGPGGLSSDDLQYRHNPSAVRQVALAPVPRPSNDSASWFLVADSTQDDRLDRPRARALMAQFARVVGALLDVSEPVEPETTQQPVRPRREIIAEEMEQARAEGLLLALALVYLNRAEDIADEGEAAVNAAERRFDARLKEVVPHARVERFGELTYGLFFNGDVPDVEAWGEHLQHDFARETGLLEGGVSIGIALLQDRHRTPDDFRRDATEALREAYASGTCTILE